MTRDQEAILALTAENERLRGGLQLIADDTHRLMNEVARQTAASILGGKPVGAADQPNGATWQPIETAPKQRKIIVHYLNEAEKHRTVMACYYGEKSLEMHDDYDDVGTWDEESGTLFADAGWYEEHDSDNPILPLGGVPTHWMQLPEPPATTDPTPAPQPQCACEYYWPGQGHHPDCPTRATDPTTDDPIIHAQHEDTGRTWMGPRSKLPLRYFEVCTDERYAEQVTPFPTDAAP